MANRHKTGREQTHQPFSVQIVPGHNSRYVIAHKRLSSFRKVLYRTLVEGFLCDPLHGGNAGLIGWQLLGYPGPLMTHRDQIDKNLGQPWRRKPRGLAEILGRPVKGWED